jgi:hypothetical protein
VQRDVDSGVNNSAASGLTFGDQMHSIWSRKTKGIGPPPPLHAKGRGVELLCNVGVAVVLQTNLKNAYKTTFSIIDTRI